MLGSESFTEKCRFIIALGKALHKYGTPAYRLEAHLQNVSSLLEVEASFLVTPTSLTFLLADTPLGLLNDEADGVKVGAAQEYNHMVRVTPGDIDLGALARIDALVDELGSGQRTLREAIERFNETSNKAVYTGMTGRLITFLAFGTTSASFAMLMSASWSSVLWSSLLGLLVALVTFWSERSRRVSHMLEPFVALMAALIVSAVAVYDPSVHVPLVILSSIIVYIPGLALTLGLSELAARHLTSGTARIRAAAMSLFNLFFDTSLVFSSASLDGDYNLSIP